MVSNIFRAGQIEPDRLKGSGQPVVIHIKLFSPQADGRVHPVFPFLPVKLAGKDIFYSRFTVWQRAVPLSSPIMTGPDSNAEGRGAPAAEPL